MPRGRKLDKNNETVEQRIAFEEYLKMGDGRNLTRVADLTGKNPMTIQRWSVVFDWLDRVNRIDNQNIDTAGIESIAEQMDKRKHNLQLVDVMLKETAVIDEDGNIVSSKVKLKSMTDIRTALEVREALLGTAKSVNGKGNIENIEKAVFIIKK